MKDAVDWLRLECDVNERFVLGPGSIHGPSHWRRVAAIADAIALANGGDRTVARLFALCHDACRAHDADDPEHGPRAARFVRARRGSVIRVSRPRLALLEHACELHSRGLVTTDPTATACWDADRLDLVRVGVRPDP